MFLPLHRGLIAGLLTLAVSSAAAAPDPSQRIAELNARAAAGPQGAPALVAALKDPLPQVRIAAVQLLAAMKGKSAVSEIAPLVSDRDDAVAVRAVGALFEIGGDQSTAPIRAAMHSPSPRVRKETASLAGDTRAVPLVKDLGALLSDDVPGVRRTAVEALRAIGDPSTFPFLMAATGDAVPATVASAVSGLENLKDARALARLTQLAAAASAEVRAAVAHAIASLSGPATDSAVFLRLVKDPDPGVRRGAATGLRDTPSSGAVPFLVTLAKDGDAGVRRLAVQALREQTSPAATVALAAVLEDADENVRATAVQALGARAARDQSDRVAALASDVSERVRAAVATTLGDFGRAEDLAALKRLAADRVPSVRAAAIVAAARIQAPDSLPIVASGGKDADPVVRLESVRALSILGTPEALVALRAIAAAGDLTSRIAAIDQLGALKDRGAIPLLRKLAQEPAETLRAAARRALETIGA